MPELDQAGGATSGKLAHVQQWIDEKKPIQLSINERVNLTVEDEKSRRLLLDLVDRLEMLEDIKTSRRELDEGKGLSLQQAKEHARQKYGISV